MTELEKSVRELYDNLEKLTTDQLTDLLLSARDEDERKFIMTMYTFRMQRRQEQVIKEEDFVI